MDDSDNVPTIQSVHLEQLNGFTGNETACSIDYDADTNETITTTYVNQAENMITTVANNLNRSALMATNVVQNGLLISSSSFSVASPTLYFYDALGCTNRIQEPLGNSASCTYDPATGWRTSSTDPAGNVTTYVYYGINEANSGRLKCQTGPTGKNTYYAYTTFGMLFQTWGDVPYPAQYNYSEYGDLTNLITFHGGNAWTSSSWPTGSTGSGDNTYWIYDDVSGALLQKIDAQGNATTYTYDPVTGRLSTRSWARATANGLVTVTNYYDGFGEITEKDYNDGTPSVLLNNYNRTGQPRKIVDASGTNELMYDYASRLVSVSGASGLYDGIVLSNHFNSVYGRDAMVCSGLSSTLETEYGYDSYGRMNGVSSGLDSVVYGYVPNSDLLQTTTSSYNHNAVLTTARGWDYGFRLGSIANVVNGAIVTSHDYTYDALNRRTRANLEDGSMWNYSYNNRNELTGAGRFWSDWTAVTGQQYGYAFDNIGNRTSAQSGSLGAMSTVSYTVNGLNEYTGIATPGFKDILGLAIATNAVTVNGGVADRKSEYFHKQISIANGGGPLWQNVSISAGGSTNGGLVFPASSQALAYDADGNLTNDGVWAYEWDGENRLISMSMTNIAGIASSNRLRLDFAYDFMNRRISKMVSTNSGSGFVPQSTNYFVYDGWNLIAMFTPANAVAQSFVWGMDLSGTMTNAGGIGGLLAIASSGTNYFRTYDGNGNITGLINGTDKSTGARYEYSPFGELLRATGPMAKLNPFRFSTKFCDDESGLVYYGYRYYNPAQGRWVGRDPSVEQAFVDPNQQLTGDDLLSKATEPTFLFVDNDAINNVDLDGRDRWAVWTLGHKYVVVQTWNGNTPTGYKQIDFGPKGLGGFMSALETILPWTDNYVAGQTVVSPGSQPGFFSGAMRIKSSPQADRMLLQWANASQSQSPYYSLTQYNCISAANMALQIGIDNIGN